MCGVIVRFGNAAAWRSLVFRRMQKLLLPAIPPSTKIITPVHRDMKLREHAPDFELACCPKPDSRGDSNRSRYSETNLLGVELDRACRESYPAYRLHFVHDLAERGGNQLKRAMRA